MLTRCWPNEAELTRTHIESAKTDYKFALNYAISDEEAPLWPFVYSRKLLKPNPESPLIGILKL